MDDWRDQVTQILPLIAWAALLPVPYLWILAYWTKGRSPRPLNRARGFRRLTLVLSLVPLAVGALLLLYYTVVLGCTKVANLIEDFEDYVHPQTPAPGELRSVGIFYSDAPWASPLAKYLAFVAGIWLAYYLVRWVIAGFAVPIRGGHNGGTGPGTEPPGDYGCGDKPPTNSEQAGERMPGDGRPLGVRSPVNAAMGLPVPAADATGDPVPSTQGNPSDARMDRQDRTEDQRRPT